MLGDDSNTEPPDSIPNSVVKRISGDGSVGLPHVRVAHRQAPNNEKAHLVWAFLFMQYSNLLCWHWRVAHCPRRDGAPNKTTLSLTAGGFLLCLGYECYSNDTPIITAS